MVGLFDDGPNIPNDGSVVNPQPVATTPPGDGTGQAVATAPSGDGAAFEDLVVASPHTGRAPYNYMRSFYKFKPEDLQNLFHAITGQPTQSWRSDELAQEVRDATYHRDQREFKVVNADGGDEIVKFIVTLSTRASTMLTWMQDAFDKYSRRKSLWVTPTGQEEGVDLMTHPGIRKTLIRALIDVHAPYQLSTTVLFLKPNDFTPIEVKFMNDAFMPFTEMFKIGDSVVLLQQHVAKMYDTPANLVMMVMWSDVVLTNQKIKDVHNGMHQFVVKFMAPNTPFCQEFDDMPPNNRVFLVITIAYSAQDLIHKVRKHLLLNMHRGFNILAVKSDIQDKLHLLGFDMPITSMRILRRFGNTEGTTGLLTNVENDTVINTFVPARKKVDTTLTFEIVGEVFNTIGNPTVPVATAPSGDGAGSEEDVEEVSDDEADDDGDNDGGAVRSPVEMLLFDELHILQMPTGELPVGWLVEYVSAVTWFRTRCPDANGCVLQKLDTGTFHTSASEVPLAQMGQLKFRVVPVPQLQEVLLQPVATAPSGEDTALQQPDAALQDGSLSSTYPLVACFPKPPPVPSSLPLPLALPSSPKTNRGRKHSSGTYLPFGFFCKTLVALTVFPYICGFPQKSNLPQDVPKT